MYTPYTYFTQWTRRYIFPLLFILSASSLTIAIAADNPSTNRSVLKVCADPHYTPFSTQALDGYENKLASLIGQSLGIPVEYTWFPQRIGFIRNTLRKPTADGQAYMCDIVMGVPASYELTLTSAPYMQSSYVLVVNSKGKLAQLTQTQQLLGGTITPDSGYKIGVTERSPGAEWIAKHGLFQAMQPYVAQSGDANEYPGQPILEDMLAGKLDAAIVWGPTAGHFVKQSPKETPYRLLAMPAEPGIRFNYEIATGVRFGEKAWRDQINQILAEHKQQVQQILTDYGIPLVNAVGEVLIPSAHAAESTPAPVASNEPNSTQPAVTVQETQNPNSNTTTTTVTITTVTNNSATNGANPAVTTPNPTPTTDAHAATPAAAPATTSASATPAPNAEAAAPATTPTPEATHTTERIPATVTVAPAAATPALTTTMNANPATGSKPYEGHIKCDSPGTNCKIDSFLMKGFRTFGQCQVCHGMDAGGTTIAPSLLQRFHDLDKATVFDRITNGYKGQIGVMPPWKENPNIMNNIENLYAYLLARSDGVLPAGTLERY